MYPTAAEIIVFYDSDCLFCTKSITCIDRLDKRKVIYFSTLRGSLGCKKGLDKYCTSHNGSIVVLDTKTDKIYVASKAIIKIASHIITLKPFAKIVNLLPRQVCDVFYYLISNNRYIISKHLKCSIPSKELRDRII
jgi:predicted DCC family thiol-disulfide oxidoreductase YuxK